MLSEEECKNRNACVSCNTDRNQGRGRVFRGQPPEDQCRREGDNLGQKQGQQQAGRVQPQSRTVGRRHVDDGVHAVDVAEESQQEPEHLLIFIQVLDGMADADKTLPDGVFFHLDIVELFITFQQRQGRHQPPDRRDEQGDIQGRHLRQADSSCTQHQCQTDHKRHTTANVTPRIATGGDFVHPLRRRDIAQHRVIKDQTAREADLCNDKDDEEGQPCRREAHCTAADHAHDEAEHKNGLFEVFRIGQRA